MSELPSFFLQQKTNTIFTKKYVEKKFLQRYNAITKTINHQNLINIKNLIKHHFLFYVDLECLIEKIDGSKLTKIWQAYYQILSIIFLKELIKLNINADKMIKNVKLVELRTNYANVFLNKNILKMI